MKPPNPYKNIYRKIAKAIINQKTPLSVRSEHFCVLKKEWLPTIENERKSVKYLL
jgi:hypothetical protein